MRRKCPRKHAEKLGDTVISEFVESSVSKQTTSLVLETLKKEEKLDTNQNSFHQEKVKVSEEQIKKVNKNNKKGRRCLPFLLLQYVKAILKFIPESHTTIIRPEKTLTKNRVNSRPEEKSSFFGLHTVTNI